MTEQRPKVTIEINDVEVSARWGNSPECLEIIRHLTFDKGLSSAAVGRYFHVSRNAVIGKLHRNQNQINGYVKRGPKPGARKASGALPKIKVTVKYVPPPTPPPPLLEPVVLESSGLHVTMETVSDKLCRFPVGDPADSDFHFCGHEPKTGRPYCEAHCVVAYQKPKPYARKDHIKKENGKLF